MDQAGSSCVSYKCHCGRHIGGSGGSSNWAFKEPIEFSVDYSVPNRTIRIEQSVGGFGSHSVVLIEPNPAAGRVSPLFYAVESDNQTLIAYLLTFKGAMHFEGNGNCLELSGAAYWGRSKAAILILTRVRESKPRAFQRYLGDAVVGMIWNKQKTAAAELLSKYRPELSDGVIAKFRKDVLLVDGPTSGKMLDDVWEAAKEAR